MISGAKYQHKELTIIPDEIQFCLTGASKMDMLGDSLCVTTGPHPSGGVFVLTQKLPELGDKWLKAWGKCAIMDMVELAADRRSAQDAQDKCC